MYTYKERKSLCKSRSVFSLESVRHRSSLQMPLCVWTVEEGMGMGFLPHRWQSSILQEITLNNSPVCL